MKATSEGEIYILSISRLAILYVKSILRGQYLGLKTGRIVQFLLFLVTSLITSSLYLAWNSFEPSDHYSVGSQPKFFIANFTKLQDGLVKAILIPFLFDPQTSFLWPKWFAATRIFICSGSSSDKNISWISSLFNPRSMGQII